MNSVLFDAPKLFCPGPTPLSQNPENSTPLIYHRSEQFQKLLKDCRTKLNLVFNCAKDLPPLILSCSGTGAMEAAMIHFTDPNDQIIVYRSRKIWKKMG